MELHSLLTQACTTQSWSRQMHLACGAWCGHKWFQLQWDQQSIGRQTAVQFFCKKAIADSTHKTYESTLQRFGTFCSLRSPYQQRRHLTLRSTWAGKIRSGWYHQTICPTSVPQTLKMWPIQARCEGLHWPHRWHAMSSGCSPLLHGIQRLWVRTIFSLLQWSTSHQSEIYRPYSTSPVWSGSSIPGLCRTLFPHWSCHCGSKCRNRRLHYSCWAAGTAVHSLSTFEPPERGLTDHCKFLVTASLCTFNPQNMKWHSALQEHELMIFIGTVTLIDLNGQVTDDIHWQGCLKITHWSGELMILAWLPAWWARYPDLPPNFPATWPVPTANILQLQSDRRTSRECNKSIRLISSIALNETAKAAY